MSTSATPQDLQGAAAKCALRRSTQCIRPRRPALDNDNEAPSEEVSASMLTSSDVSRLNGSMTVLEVDPPASSATLAGDTIARKPVALSSLKAAESTCEAKADSANGDPDNASTGATTAAMSQPNGSVTTQKGERCASRLDGLGKRPDNERIEQLGVELRDAFSPVITGRAHKGEPESEIADPNADAVAGSEQDHHYLPAMNGDHTTEETSDLPHEGVEVPVPPSTPPLTLLREVVKDAEDASSSERASDKTFLASARSTLCSAAGTVWSTAALTRSLLSARPTRR